MTGNVFQRSLARQLSKQPKVAGLFLIWGASVWALSLYWNDLDEPQQFFAVIPLAVIYALEKQGICSFFRGLSLPVLAVSLSAHLFVLTSSMVSKSATWMSYVALTALVTALFFLTYRMWTVGGVSER